MKLRRIGLVVGVVSAMVLGLTQVAISAPSTVFDISFDGYCDGMQLNVPSVGLGTPDTVDGHHTGCITGGLAGTVSRGMHITTNYGGASLLHYRVFGNRTWTVYGQSGDLITFINSGTWSPGPPAGLGQASGSVRAGAAAAGPTTTFDISFDGYCDGLQMNVPSVGLGTSDTVDGHHTGCIAGGLAGTVSGGMRITTNYGGFSLFHIKVLGNRTWVIYGQSGDLITQVNTGTWSPGPPTGTGPAAAG